MAGDKNQIMKQQAPLTLNLKTLGFVNFYFPNQLPAVAGEKEDGGSKVGYLSAVIENKRYFAIVDDAKGSVVSTLGEAKKVVETWDEKNDVRQDDIEAVYRNNPKIPPHVFDAIAFGVRLDTKKGTESARAVLVDGMTVNEAVKLTGRQHTQTNNAVDRISDIFWALSPLLK